ncbi:hypothetical protein GXP67_16885 [Rhodocytophaga rosea]|uniref:Uncharacterized protein n=1 Tax=Rhodocytophaga rosea TaxID=2704465 RepID=A0A6C0GJS9_9BACT|nr:hypothetical protein [Rhodocytophaga rosea]QHT68197.1 hypothetical protein GXP67_16885 [Rhodocytophaga rosea]
MKKLKLISTLIVAGLITMSMGFPTDLMNGRITDESEKENCLFATVSNVVVMTTVEFGKTNMRKKPIQELPTFHATEYSDITVKLFDPKGLLIMTQQISMDDFLASNEKSSLPNGSTFVMFHESTAYYFLEAGLMN